MNMGSTDSPPTYPLQNSFKEVAARFWLAGAKAAAEANKEARTKDFIFTTACEMWLDDDTKRVQWSVVLPYTRTLLVAVISRR